MILKKIKVKDIGRVVTGTTPATKIQEYYGNEFDFIKPSYIEKGTRFFDKSEMKLSSLAKEDYGNTFVPPLSTCVVTIGSIGEKMCLTKEVCLTNQQINTIIPNNNYDKLFVYYLMKYNLFKVKAANSGSSSGRENVSKSIFENIEVEVPDLISQQKISKILSSYDDLIENNLKRIKLLEESAELIYKEWFINFRFLGHQKKEFINGKPNDWKEESLGKFFPIATGKKNANVSMQDGKYKFFTCSQDVLLTNEYSFEAKAILLAGNGEFNVKYYEGKFDAYQRTYVLIPYEDKYFYYLYEFIKYNLSMLTNGSKGSVIKYLTKDMIESYYVYEPNPEIINSYNSIITPIYRQIEKLMMLNEKLKETRDILIPKLITGEIEV